MRSLIYVLLIAGCGEVVTAKPDAAPPPTFKVTVAVAGPGTGKITSPSGIDCAPDCESDAVPSGTEVTLTAVPDSGSELSSWGVPECADPAAPCVITVASNVTVNASFKKLFASCAEINASNGFQVVIEPGKVVLGPDAAHTVRCTQVDGETIRIGATTANAAMHFSNEGIFAGRGVLDQTVRDRPENIVNMCKRLGYPYAWGRSTTVNANIAVTVSADFNTFQVAAAGDDWTFFECSRMSKGKTCDQINDANGFQVVINPGQIVLGPDAGHPVRCMQVSDNQIHIFETGNFDTLRYAPIGAFAGRGTFDQAVRNIPEQIERVCNFLGYPFASGTTTAVNSSIEALVNADMAGFTVQAAGDDWLTFDCKH